MSAQEYYKQITGVLSSIHDGQANRIQEAGELCASTIAAGNRVYLFGSGHSVIPVMDIFPRYGSFVGFFPLYDPRLMWHNVVGPGGARELLWLERREGYITNFLQSFAFNPGDAIIVFSHGGLNAAPIEAALYAKQKGMKVITVSSLGNAALAQVTHSSGNKLSDIADIALDNCVPPEDALVNIGYAEKVAAGSTMAVVFLAMALVAETAARLKDKGIKPNTFVSPNVPGISKDHNLRVFDDYSAKLYDRSPVENVTA
jgi:uncharacterized phosphosugar-binding protein